MVKVTFKRYLLVNSFEKNEDSILKYYRHYEVEKFNEYIEKRKFTVKKKGVDKKQPLYNFEMR